MLCPYFEHIALSLHLCICYSQNSSIFTAKRIDPSTVCVEDKCFLNRFTPNCNQIEFHFTCEIDMYSFRKIAVATALGTIFTFNLTVNAFAQPQPRSQHTIASRNVGLKRPRPKKRVSRELAQKLQAALDQVVRDNQLPGATVGIVTPQGRWFGASGVSNLETQEPMRVNDIFGTASVTKIFTAVTVLKLVEEGVLSLDDTLEKWLPEIASKIPDGKTITIRQLLNGTAGVYNYPDDEKFLADYIAETQKQFATGEVKRWRPEELLEYVYGKPRFQGGGCTGGKWCYTNTSSVLAGMVVEKATGSSFASVLRDKVLNPLRLKRTFFSGDEEIVGRQARGYQDLFKADGSFGQDDIPDDLTEANFSAFWANGALFSNAKDLTRFMLALSGDKLLEPESLNQMLTFVDISQFGLGVESRELPWGKAWGKGGDHPGYQAYVLHFPDSDITIVTLVNRQYETENPEKQFTALTPAVYTAILNTLQAEMEANNSR